MSVHRKVKIHLLFSFIILPIFFGLFFVPFINIPIFIAFALLSLPFGFAISYLTPSGFVDDHFGQLFAMLAPSDFIGWLCFGTYFLIVFNLIALIFSRQPRPKKDWAENEIPGVK